MHVIYHKKNCTYL